MPNVSQRSKPGKASPVTVIDTHEQIVREYLNSLESPPEPKTFNPAEVTKGIDDPIEKLRALREAKRRSSVNDLEDRFVEVAARWAAKNEMGRDLFATLGVPTTVLRRAFGGAPSKRGGEGRTRVSIDVLTSGIAARPKGAKLTVAEISEEIGGSPATVRKVLDQLTKDGVVANEGPDLNYGGRGRAPIVFVRK